ncbi:MAG: SDR family NAD(P)-dependent oxidoreductase, partial [Terracidiphilus sp.]
MLDSLAQLYVYGAEVNWTGFDLPYPRRRLPLPTYPFQRQSYWLRPPVRDVRHSTTVSTEQARSELAATPANTDESIGEPNQWFYRVTWRQRDLPQKTEELSCRHWIVLPDASGVAKALADRMRSTGCKSILIENGLPELERELAQADTARTGIIDLRCLDVEEGSAEQPCLALAALIQKVAQIDRPGVTVWSITRGAQATGRETQPVLPWLAPAWALGRTIVSEHAELWGGMVDLDPSAGSAENADFLWRHLIAFDGEDQSAFRNGCRLVARLARFLPPPVKSPEFRADAAYLITGGYGGLGLEVARWMVRHGAKRIILLGRTPLLPRGEWGKLGAEDPRGRIVSSICEIEKLGATIQTAAVDVGDANALQRFFRSYEDEHGLPIRGLVHAAGAMKHALVSDATADDFRISFKAKVDGTWLLHQALRQTDLDFFVLFSSASAVLSSPRLGPYAASNAFLDAIAEYRNREGLPSLSVNWGIWTGVGMAGKSDETAARSLAERGMAGMKVEEGLACLGSLMAAASGQVCVLPLDWKKWDELYPAYMAKPFFSELMGENRTESAAAGGSQPANEFLDRLKDAPEMIRVDLIRDFVQRVAVSLLGFPADHRLDPLQPLNELGLDSLMAVELRNAIAAKVAQTLPATLLFNYPAVEEITMYLAKLLFGASPNIKQVGSLSEAKRNALDDIEGLSDEEVDRILDKNWNPVNE